MAIKYMKNYFKIITGAGLISLVLPLSLYAQNPQNNSASTTRGDLKDKVQERMEAKKAELESGVKERFGLFIDRVMDRFNAVMDRFDKIVLRIESRISKIKSEGGKTEEVEALLTTAKGKMDVAKASIAEIKSKADLAIAGDLKALYPSVREQIKKAKEDVKLAHEALVDVIKNLKPGANKTED